MTLLNRLKPALQSTWLPLALLLLALSTVFVFGGDRGYFYRCCQHNYISSHHLTVAVNLSPEHGFQRFDLQFMDDDGVVHYFPYNRFPIGGYLLMKAATLPFGGNLSDQIYAVRMLMLLFFAAAAVLAYLSLCRLVSNRWIALTATLLSFSSYYLLYYNDMTAAEGMLDFFMVMLAFHGMVVFVQQGRFRQLLVKTCIALLIGWHILALLLPFVIIGLVQDLIRARSAAAASTPSALCQLIASTLLRSRYLLLGVVALAFGLSVLTFNFTMEYVGLGGETPLTELPSFESMLRHTNVNHGVVLSSYPWAAFWEVQFQRIFLMFVPYGLIGSGGIIESNPWQTEFQGRVILAIDSNSIVVTEYLSKFQGTVLGVVLSGACLIGLMFVRQRMLFATLASFGFFWALPMDGSAMRHPFESIYYIGIPLVFFTIVLLLAMRLSKRDGVIVAAAFAALAIFAVSSFQMSRMGHGAESAQVARAVEQDLIAIHKFVEGEPVTVLNYEWEYYLLRYYLHQSIFRTRISSLTDHEFIVVGHRNDAATPLTPQNQRLFLYDTAGWLALYRSMYRSVISTEPVARDEFDVYLIDGTLYYLKEECESEDVREAFFLHVLPEDINDLSEDRRQYRFDNLYFGFDVRGLLFDGRCLASVDLPEYDIAGFRTGQAGRGWNIAHVIQGPKLISEYPSIVSTEPAARSEFNLYLAEGKLHYVKESCGSDDVQDGFFLHIIPADLDDLPDNRTEHGFDNLDFGFDVRGIVFDGKCMASIGLPQYDIARITTGQYDEEGRIWAAEIVSEYPSIVSGEPIARSEFDLYLAKGKLHYVKEPCDSEDVEDGFFLHIVPEDIDDLPDARTEYGFDNLDFGFDVRGVQFDGKCLASIDLPQYGIARITTGQYDGVDRIWAAEIDLEANE